MKPTQPTPVSNADNMYDFTTDLINTLEQEPARLLMDTWETMKDGHIYYPHLAQKLSRLPDCGTVCCVEGWIRTLNGSGDKPWLNGSGLYPQPMQPELRNLFYTFPDLSTGEKPGTIEYVKAITNVLRELQVRHADALKATPHVPGFMSGDED